MCILYMYVRIYIYVFPYEHTHTRVCMTMYMRLYPGLDYMRGASVLLTPDTDRKNCVLRWNHMLHYCPSYKKDVACVPYTNSACRRK